MKISNFVLFITVLFCTNASHATFLRTSETNILGIDDVLVDGTYFDVTFYDDLLDAGKHDTPMINLQSAHDEIRRLWNLDTIGNPWQTGGLLMVGCSGQFTYCIMSTWHKVTVTGKYATINNLASYNGRASETFGGEVNITSSNVVTYMTWEISEVPTPAAFWLMGTALVGLMGYSRKNKSQSVAA